MSRFFEDVSLRAKPYLFLTVAITALMASPPTQGQVPGAPTVTAPANGETVTPGR